MFQLTTATTTRVAHRVRWLATLTAVPLGLGLNLGDDMDVCKCLMPSRQGGTLNSRRAASPLIRVMNKPTPPQKRLRRCIHLAFRNAKRLLRDKLRQKRISTLTDLAIGKSWSCLFDGQRRAQLSALSRVEGVTCFRIITGHDYLQAHLFKIGLTDSPLCLLCKSVPITGEHLSDCSALLHVLSQDNWSSPSC
ncbi:gag-Pol polyprotein [Trichonephila clavipes]|nr:gag-Pol polyprotein [Trichonephila clavipes]